MGSSAYYRSKKWKFLKLDASWDRATVPIYESIARGRPFPLLKTLLFSYCDNECKFCALRRPRKCPRFSWNPEKLARLTFNLYKSGKIKGLFLSSSVFKDPDYTVMKEVEVIRSLREMGYEGYIHLRLMPGVSRELIKEGVMLADRIGVNLEAPTSEIFGEICPDKGDFRNDVVKRLEWVVEESKKARREGATWGSARAGVDTQFVIGAIPDNDKQYLEATSWLYQTLGLRRVYYSGFEPIPNTPFEKNKPCDSSRVYRLHQASFLLRDYGFKAEELKSILNEVGFLPNVDPKLACAMRNIDLFPVDLNMAEKHQILRVPGIGPVMANRILRERKRKRIVYLRDLEKIIGRGLARRASSFVSLKSKADKL